MKHYIPDNEKDRLEQLNDGLTEIICSKDYFIDEKWLPLRLNLRKWKTLHYSISQNHQPFINDFSKIELLRLYHACNNLSEVMLIQKEIKEVILLQQFEKAALLRDIGLDRSLALSDLYKEMKVVIPFFYLSGNRLILKCIDNYFIHQYVKEKLRF